MTGVSVPPRRRRRLLTSLGVVLILAGVGFLGYVAWQYFGTNVVSKHAQKQIKEQLVVEWDNGIDGDAVGLLRVPRFGDDYEVPILEGFDDDTLAKGVGMYPDGAAPGEIGNVALAGHRVTHGEPFRKFLELRAGDEVVIETRTHVYTYKLEGNGDAIKVDFTVGWPLQAVPDPDERGTAPTEAKLTLLTCSELFHTRDRNIVIGDLVDTVEKKAPVTSSSSGG